MSLQRIEQRLAALLSTPALAVGTGVAGTGGATVTAAVAIEGVGPLTALATRLPVELRRRELQRVSSVTVRVVLTVGPAIGARAAALEAATDLWWRCEDATVATGAGFPGEGVDELTQGYRVLEVRTLTWETPEAPLASPQHRIALDIDALVWPAALAPQAGPEIEEIHVLLSGTVQGTVEGEDGAELGALTVPVAVP